MYDDQSPRPSTARAGRLSLRRPPNWMTESSPDRPISLRQVGFLGTVCRRLATVGGRIIPPRVTVKREQSARLESTRLLRPGQGAAAERLPAVAKVVQNQHFRPTADRPAEPEAAVIRYR